MVKLFSNRFCTIVDIESGSTEILSLSPSVYIY